MTNDIFLTACRGRRPERVPVWFMRQAGRCLPEYRALRERHSILELCRTPELAAEVTLQPIRRLGVDAAILFSDIVVPLAPLGIDLDIKEGVGPIISNPVRAAEDVERLRPLEEDDVGFVSQTVSELARGLDIPLIGFGGAPFTLASYLVEGGPSKTHALTKTLMRSDAHTWNLLMEKLSDALIVYLRAQIAAGASAVQLFDSWVGALSPFEYVEHVLPHVTRIFKEIEDTGVPRILFGVVTGELLEDMASSGADVMGIDWRVPLDRARRRLGSALPLQGNLDPTVCLAPWEVVEREARTVLVKGAGGPHVFNLGHGVLPDTDPDTLARLVDLVHGWRPDE
ncbi:MAG: uroporphyrinogen decarboxylase [Actinomycetota bacterium]|nr:uroporphyrinogen decarboxylase [Actinomycetota bacterium]